MSQELREGRCTFNVVMDLVTEVPPKWPAYRLHALIEAIEMSGIGIPLEQIATFYGTKAVLLIQLEKPADAEKYARAALRALKNKEMRPRLLLLGMLFVAAHVQGNHQEALRYAEEQIALLARHEVSPDLAVRIWMNAGVTHLELGHYDQAQSSLLNALGLQREGLGPTHVGTADIYRQLAAFYCMAGRADVALPYAEEGVRIFREAHGAESKEVSDVLGVLGMAQAALGNESEARHSLDLALRVRLAACGPQSREAATAYLQMGIGLLELADHRSASDALLQAYQTDLELVGPHHVVLATCLKYIGLAIAPTDIAAAEQSFEQALDVRRSNRQMTHPQALDILSHLLNSIALGGELSRALERRERAIREIRSEVEASEPGVEERRERVAKCIAKIRFDEQQPSSWQVRLTRAEIEPDVRAFEYAPRPAGQARVLNDSGFLSRVRRLMRTLRGNQGSPDD